MAQLEIYLTGEDMDRLFICKAKEGKHNLTANEYAQALLVRELHRLFPQPPRYDEDGQLINGDCYQGNP